MIKKILFSGITSLLLATLVFAQPGKQVKDGLYLINKLDTVDLKPSAEEALLRFNPMFDEFNEEKNTRILVSTKEFVPLELGQAPTAEQQTENKKKLLMNLSKEASEQLKTFTAKHVMNMVAVVVDGEVLTIHMIKEAITSGQLQITRCNDNACELLFVKLKDNVKK
jgi:preprotein translocase subunit SecD